MLLKTVFTPTKAVGLAVLILSTAGCSGGGADPSGPPGAMDEAQHQVTDALFTKCGDVWVTTAANPIMHFSRLIEAKGVKLVFGPPNTLTEADRANGVQYNGNVFLQAALSRYSINNGKDWKDWEPGLSNSPLLYGQGGIPFVFQKRNNKWISPTAADASSLMQPGPCEK